MSNLKSTYNQFKGYKPAIAIPKKEFVIKDDEFPDLASPVKNNKNSNVMSFASLLKRDEEKEKEKEIVEEEYEEIVPDGWSYYKYTKFKNGLCGDKNSEVTTKIQKPFIDKKYEVFKPKVVLNEAEEIINALSLLHEKRTNEYKELWGEAEWERMFICPNYDYEYFDKLDEAYETEQYNLNSQYSDHYEDSDSY